MWRYVWRKSPIILRLSFWMILDSKTCLCQMSDHEKWLIIHDQCLWNRPFCQVITNWQCSAFLLLFLSIWSFSDQFSHQIITALGHKIIAHAQMSRAFSHLSITWSTPDQCLIISWSMFDHRSINAWSSLDHPIVVVTVVLSLTVARVRPTVPGKKYCQLWVYDHHGNDTDGDDDVDEDKDERRWRWQQLRSLTDH